MKRLILFIYYVTIITNVFSQAQEIGKTEGELLYNLDYYLNKNKEIKDNEILGSPYLYEKFVDGKVYFKERDKQLNSILNYNAFSDEIDFRIDEKIYSFKNPEDVLKIVTDEGVLVFNTYVNNNSVKKGFLIELVDNKISLYKKEKIVYVHPKEARNAYEKDKPGRYNRIKPQFYISVNDNTAFVVKNKKSLLKEFRKRLEISDFLKKEKVNLKSEEDIIRLVKYINQFFDYNL